jgi:virulence-associated protein VapD
MKAAGLTKYQIVSVYQKEIPEALAQCGFVVHPQGSLYHTNTEQNPITAIMKLQSSLQQGAPQFCQFVRKVQVFRMEEWSDVTDLIRTSPVAGADTPISAEDEADQAELAAS